MIGPHRTVTELIGAAFLAAGLVMPMIYSDDQPWNGVGATVLALVIGGIYANDARHNRDKRR